jgi:hypothetical protein
MAPVNEADNEDEDADQEFNPRKYLDAECEKMLKDIQRKDKQAFLDIFQDYPEDIDEEELIEVQKLKPFIIDELG